MPKGYEGRTTCFSGKHDITLPGATKLNSDGTKYCAQCHKDRRKLRDNTVQKTCRNCGILLPLGRAWAFCSNKCKGILDSKNGVNAQKKESAKTNTLLWLYSQLDRASLSWEKADLMKKIQAVIASKELT
jgi:predicted nucleic acid-binding Zn ribbon protein